MCTFSCAHAVRPQKPIPYDTLRDYVLAGLTLPKMVAALALIGIKVCPKTVSRRLEQVGLKQKLSDTDVYTEVARTLCVLAVCPIM